MSEENNARDEAYLDECRRLNAASSKASTPSSESLRIHAAMCEDNNKRDEAYWDEGRRLNAASSEASTPSEESLRIHAAMCKEQEKRDEAFEAIVIRGMNRRRSRPPSPTDEMHDGPTMPLPGSSASSRYSRDCIALEL